jgi:Uma2 family endonuclease
VPHDEAAAAPIAPEICVEVRSPSNTDAEMDAKRALYFEAGAEEVWICDEDGAMRFYDADGEMDASHRAPAFPAHVEL